MTRQAPRFDGLKAASQPASKTKSRNPRADTKCEVLLRSALWRMGLRFRKNVSNLPGKPDVVFPRQRVAVFCDGDFWHGRDWLRRERKLAQGNNPDYWIPKIRSNMVRDRAHDEELAGMGWIVVRIWESEIHSDVGSAADSVERAIQRSFPGQVQLVAQDQFGKPT